MSVHKEQGEVWDWTLLVAALPPPSPQRNARHEHKAKQRATVLPAHQRDASHALIDQARLQDEQEFQQATQAYSEQMAEWEKLRILAQRILAGENKEVFAAYLKSWADLGNLHIQFNVVDRETLLDAQTHPEKYSNLSVRVAGYSAFYIHLDAVVQNEIIKRTELRFS